MHLFWMKICRENSIQYRFRFISGGSDAKIKIWNLSQKVIEKEIVGHKSPVAEMIMIENPFDVDKQKMFNIISVGTGEDVLRVSSSLSPLNSGVYLSEKVSCEFGATSAPLL
jgi:WD40 repeat protein